MQSYVAVPLSRKDIRKYANQLREMLGLNNQFWFPIIHFLEFVMPQIDPEFFLDIRTIDELQNCHGLALPDEHRIIIREDVYLRAINNIGRDRLTTAHEIGHYFLHKKGNVALARVLPGKGRVPAFIDPEWQATAFAGELLVPYYLVDGLNEEEVANFCGVSYSAARKQLQHR